jgi:Kef-type K+ transport system membrane component KefB
VLQAPLAALAGSIGLGMAAGYGLSLSMRLLRGHGPFDMLPELLLLGAIVAIVGGAKAVGFSPSLAVLATGFACRNINDGEALLAVDIEPLRNMFVCILFVHVGSALNLLAWRNVPTWSYDSIWMDTAVWVVLFLLVRSLVRVLVPWLLAPLSGIRHRQGACLGVALLPMSSFAILAVHTSMFAMPDLDRQVAIIAVAALSALEILGPFTTRWALRYAHEATPQTEVMPS